MIHSTDHDDSLTVISSGADALGQNASAGSAIRLSAPASILRLSAPVPA